MSLASLTKSAGILMKNSFLGTRLRFHACSYLDKHMFFRSIYIRFINHINHSLVVLFNIDLKM